MSRDHEKEAVEAMVEAVIANRRRGIAGEIDPNWRPSNAEYGNIVADVQASLAADPLRAALDVPEDEAAQVIARGLSATFYSPESNRAKEKGLLTRGRKACRALKDAGFRVVRV